MYSYLVNEVECHSPLSNPHLFRLPVVTVLSSDPVHTFL